MESVGQTLRRERIKQGIDLTALAAMTRISVRYLEAIEVEDTANLPGGFFYRSFVRQYASALGLDTDDIEAQLERVREAERPILTAALEKSEFPTKQPDPIVAESNRKVSPARTWVYVVALAGVLAGCSAVYAWWHRIEFNAAAQHETAAEPAPVKTPADAPKAGRDTASAPPPSEDRPASAQSEAPRTTAAQPPVGVPVTRPADSANTASAPPAGNAANPPAPDYVPAPDHRVVLNLTASEMVWVSVTADGKPIFTGVINANETKTLGGKESARIRVGNAGGLGVTWNGKSIGSLGPRGQVRTVLLTPDSYQIIVPTPQAAVPAQPPSGEL